MGLDPALAAAATFQRTRAAGGDVRQGEGAFQLSLAHVLLDGGYDGAVTLGEVIRPGDYGLGTFDRLDGELVVVDGEPWRIDAQGAATVMPPETRTPFVVVSAMVAPQRRPLRDVDRDGVLAAIETLVDDPAAVVAVRLVGRFRSVVIRSVPPQAPPYRPYAEVCAADEVRWRHEPFEGEFVGFRFPDLGDGATIPGLHLHGVDRNRSTGGHNHELHVDEAELIVSRAHEVVVALPDRSMLDLLEMPDDQRTLQRLLLRRGPLSAPSLAAASGRTEADVGRGLSWLADRGFVEEWREGIAGLGGAPRWRVTLSSRHPRLPRRIENVLSEL